MKSILESRPAIEIAAYRAYALSAKYQAKLHSTLEFIKSCFRLAQNPYLSCSFGKDSTVMLHLCLQIKPDIQARFIHWGVESELLDNFSEVIAAWRERYKINLAILELFRASTNDKGGDRWEQLEQLAPADGYFIGLRADEAKGRSLTLKIHGHQYKMKSGLYRFAPMANWNTNDIAAYVVANDLPMLNTYHHEGLEARTASRIARGISGIRNQQLSSLRNHAPNQFEQLKSMFPEVSDWV